MDTEGRAQGRVIKGARKGLIKEYGTSLRKRNTIKEAEQERLLEDERYQQFEGRHRGPS